MTVGQAVSLGLVQGVSEFLPISSSGHLVLLQRWFDLQQPVTAFNILLHFSTLLAVMIFFARDLIKLRWREWLVLAVASVPAALAGFLLQDLSENLFSAVRLASAMLLVTGVFNWLASLKLQQLGLKENKKPVSWRQGLVIGAFQALALLPGISRSGSTVFAGLWRGLGRLQAFRFSFILSIPAIFGATSLKALQLGGGGWELVTSRPYLLGAMTAFVAGLFSLYLFKVVMKKANLSYFAYYCFGLGLMGLFWF